MKPHRTFFALLAGLFFISVAPLSFAQEEAIDARKKLMKNNRKASGPCALPSRRRITPRFKPRQKSSARTWTKWQNCSPKGALQRIPRR